jgi:hypothetical protein
MPSTGTRTSNAATFDFSIHPANLGRHNEPRRSRRQAGM